jgi:hypothetical protein
LESTKKLEFFLQSLQKNPALSDMKEDGLVKSCTMPRHIGIVQLLRTRCILPDKGYDAKVIEDSTVIGFLVQQLGKQGFGFTDTLFFRQKTHPVQYRPYIHHIHPENTQGTRRQRR